MFYRDHTVCLCGPHTVQGGGAGGSRATPTPHWGFPVPHTHTPKIAIPQLRGDKVSRGHKETKGAQWAHILTLPEAEVQMPVMVTGRE